MLALFLTGCATWPRVVEVSGTKHVETVGAADKNLFLTDRASRITFESELLPAAERGEEFYVRWTGRNVDLVKFEYRQVNVPNTVKEQTFVPGQRTPVSPPAEGQPLGHELGAEWGWVPPHDRHWHIFAVRGADYATGGAVSAWRVSLWAGGTNGTFLAERVSAIW